MIEFLLWLVGIVAVVASYFAVGICRARAHSVELYRAAKAKASREWSIARHVEEYAVKYHRAEVTKWVWWWPYMPVIAWFQSAYTAPLEKARAAAAEARASAKTWDEVARTATTDRERDMAWELAKMLRDQAKSLDL